MERGTFMQGLVAGIAAMAGGKKVIVHDIEPEEKSRYHDRLSRSYKDARVQDTPIGKANEWDHYDNSFAVSGSFKTSGGWFDPNKPYRPDIEDRFTV